MLESALKISSIFIGLIPMSLSAIRIWTCSEAGLQGFGDDKSVFWREFHAVLDEVPKDLLETGRISLDIFLRPRNRNL